MGGSNGGEDLIGLGVRQGPKFRRVVFTAHGQQARWLRVTILCSIYASNRIKVPYFGTVACAVLRT